MRGWTAAILVAALGVSCGDDHHHHHHRNDPVVVESASLAIGDFDSCDVVGTVLNTDGDDFCDVFVSFNAFNGSETLVAQGIANVTNLPPNTRAAYAATLLTPGDNFIACRNIARIEVSDLDQFCD